MSRVVVVSANFSRGQQARAEAALLGVFPGSAEVRFVTPPHAGRLSVPPLRAGDTFIVVVRGLSHVHSKQAFDLGRSSPARYCVVRRFSGRLAEEAWLDLERRGAVPQ